jgi:hypothetical protein
VAIVGPCTGPYIRNPWFSTRGVGGFGAPFLAAIVHAGWPPAAFFDALAPQGSQFILAVTIPFFFDDASGPTDTARPGSLRQIFITLANGKVHFAPFAVMNAVDPGFPTQVLQGTDRAGHCSIWGSWPNP